MGVFTFIIVIMILSGIVAPLAKGLSRRLAKGGPDSREIAELKAELERAEQRISESERRLQLAEERMDFQEQLLSSRPAVPRIPPVDR
jgi:hypothetical protein